MSDTETNGGSGQGDDFQALLRNGFQLHQAGNLPEAEALYRRVLDADPDHADAHHLLGMIAHQTGDHETAVDLISKAIRTNPGMAAYHGNLGPALKALGRLDDAVESYRQAIALNPDFADAHYNLGNTFKDLERLEDAVDSFGKALAIRPDWAGAWNNLRFVIKALQYPKAGESRGEGRSDGLDHDALNPAARATVGYAMLEYYLQGFRPHDADDSFDKATVALPPKVGEALVVSDGRAAVDKPASPSKLPDKVVALLHFGRSGTGLLHSLIDGHPEISTLPSIYLQGFFNAGVWETISSGGWRELPGRFADEFPVLFDGQSAKPVPGRMGEVTPFLGRKAGMTQVGKNHDEVLSLDREAFCSEALRLIEGFETIDPGLFLRIIHAAFEAAMQTKNDKPLIFYHIHNPGDFTKLNFLRYVPGARLAMMVREPVQSCESWIRDHFQKNDYERITQNILTMLFDIDQVAFRRQDSIGVRLEDLKARPEATMKSLCAWLGVKDSPTLYEMTAQGKIWWGDSSSPNHKKNKESSPFDDAAIKRPVGTIFGEKERLVLGTLFYPFSIRFGYREPDAGQFKKDLKAIRPLLDDLFDFETVLATRSKTDAEKFKRGGNFRLLRAGLLDRWQVLDQLGDYPHMLSPLVLG